MSRRRPDHRPSYLRESEGERRSIRIVCAGAGGHKPEDLGIADALEENLSLVTAQTAGPAALTDGEADSIVRVYPNEPAEPVKDPVLDESVRVREVLELLDEWGAEASDVLAQLRAVRVINRRHNVGAIHMTFTFRCPACRRNMPWRAPKFKRVLVAFLLAGERRVDVAAIRDVRLP